MLCERLLVSTHRFLFAQSIVILYNIEEQMFGGEMKEDRSYVCIDLKSFYASVECVERGLDPMTTNLVVADPTRTDKTICLAITPAMKALGIKNRCRVFEIPKGVDYIMAPPRMKLYMDYSMEIYNIYLKYFSEEDIHVYSVDEVFIDVTNYTKLYHLDSEEALTEDADEITRRFYDMASGSSMYFSREVMEKVGYFDEKYYLWEDGPFLAKYLQFGKLEMAYDIVTTWYETGGVSHDNKKNAMNPYMEKDARLFDSTNRLERLDLFSYKQKRIIHFENLLFEYKYSFIKYLIYLIYIPEYISTRAYYKKRNNEIKNDVTMIESLLNDNIISH